MNAPPDGMDDERETAALLAQLKVQPPAAARTRAFARLEREFAALAPGRRRGAPRWAVAAGLAAAVLAGFVYQGTRPAAVVARVEALQGTVDVAGVHWFDGAARLAPGGSLAAGQDVAVGATGGVLLRLSPDLSVRLAADSHAHFDAGDALTLTAGEAYIDATPGARAPLRVVTPQGVVSHLGTQYLVRATPTETEVAVREGRAQLQSAGTTRVAERGTWLRRRADAAAMLAGTLAPDDARFRWIGTLPSRFPLEGATLAQFLAWFTRETGVVPIYSAGVDTGHFADVELKGSIADLGPFEALSYVLATADLAWHREGAQVVIDRASTGG